MNRAIGHWLQTNGITVIPNIRFADERSFAFCCDGISKGSTIAVGSHGCIKGRVDRMYFKQGMEYIVHKLEPHRIIVYGKAPDDIFGTYQNAGKSSGGTLSKAAAPKNEMSSFSLAKTSSSSNKKSAANMLASYSIVDVLSNSSKS